VFDIRVLFNLDATIKSDAVTMASLYWLPSWFWAAFWMAESVMMLIVTLKLTQKR
jgi:hypothetical protein